MALEHTLGNFLDIIATSSAFEMARTGTKINPVQLANQFQLAKFSNLGTPILDYVILTMQEDATQTSPLYSNKVQQTIANQVSQHGINSKSFYLDDVEITVNKTKNIVRTAVNGINSTFKEFYSDGDYLISLSGKVAGVIPFQDDFDNIKKFGTIENANKSCIVTSTFLNDVFGIENVVITDFSFTPDKQFSNIINFTISMESDIEIDIIEEL